MQRVFAGYDRFAAEIVLAASRDAGHKVELVEHHVTGRPSPLLPMDTEFWVLATDEEASAVQEIADSALAPQEGE